MAIELIQAGATTTLLNGVVYATPVDGVHRFTCDDATAIFAVSNDPNFGTSQTPTLSGSGFDNAYAYIKSTNKDAVVSCRRWSNI